MIPPALLWSGLLLSLPPPASPGCFLGKGAECQDASFAPGSDLAGEGFDITKMQRLGTFVFDMSKWKLENNTCNLCKNPFMHNKNQKIPVSVLYWRATQKCSSSVSSSVHESSESLVTSSTSCVENNWKVDLEFGKLTKKGSMMLAGTQSKLSEYSMSKTKKDKFSFIKQSASCTYYSYRISTRASLHHELSYEFKDLPAIYDKQTKESYLSFVEKFGTHFIVQVKLGGAVQSVTSVKQCEASLQDLSADEIKMCLDVEASASVKGKADVDGTGAVRHCKQDKEKKLSSHSFANSFSDRLTEITGGHTEDSSLLFSATNDPGAYKQWLSSVPEKPDIISFSLKPLHMVIPNTNPKRKELRRSIRDYILQNALLKNCSSRCSVGIARNPKEPCACTCHNNPGVKANCCPSQRGYAQISVKVLKATGLWGDYSSQADGYVKVLRNLKDVRGATAVIWNQNSPIWNWKFELGSDVLSQFGMLRLEVWDRDSGWDDDFLGACNIELKAGIKPNFCQLNHGLLYYETTVTCGPNLSGSSCTKYVGSPMAAHLEKAYVSRHALPIPKDMLVNMGVLLRERRSRFGQSSDSGRERETL